MIILLDRFRVKTEASFTAEDPWNQSRRAPFTIEDYVYVAKGTKTVRPDIKPSGDFVRGIRSEADGVERMLPDSLSELWRAGRVPAEALPRLLKEMQPALKRADFEIMLRSKAFSARLVMAWFVCAIFIGVPLWFVLTGGFAPLIGIPVVLGIAGFSWLYLYLGFYRYKWRRVEQMRWILAQL